jgi:anaerobic magnesium-protoporphyrin IX monomethyl ester cyclase
LDNVINKSIRLEQVEQAIKTAKELRLEVGTFFVIEHPGESVEDVRRTIDFATRIDPDYCQFTVSTPYPGTRLYEIVKDRLLISDWDMFGHFEGKAYFEYGEMTKPVLEEMYKKAYRDFYLRPSFIMKSILNPHIYTNLAEVLSNLKRFAK